MKHSVIGRLLEEISWGPNVTTYRGGGRGFENVLTAEVFQALDFLPRAAFLGGVVESAHGSAAARAVLRQEAEEAEFRLLPGEMHLLGENIPKVEVQPDVIVTAPNVYCLVEAKRLRQSSFQSLQLAREFVMAHNKAEGRIPLLLLILNKPPPVLVKGRGRQSLRDAIIAGLPEVITNADAIATWHEKIDETVSWITWHEIGEVVRRQLQFIDIANSSQAASIMRIVESITDSIEWHDKVRPPSAVPNGAKSE
jgi:hypothetical protein